MAALSTSVSKPEKNLKETQHTEGIALQPGDEAPRGRKEAQYSNYWPQWQQAEHVEMDVHRVNGTWRLVHISTMPKGKRLIRTKWVYALKFKPDTNGAMIIDKFKARLVAMGFSQVKDVDYIETFASVMRTKSFRVLLVLWLQDPTYTGEQWDVQAAFIQAPFVDGEQLYMSQPAGHEIEGMEDYVCILDRAIYGTKQAAHAWQAFLRGILASAGFIPLRKDDAVYKALLPDGGWCFVGTHVDDIFVITNVLGKPLRDKLWKTLSARVPITDMGTIRWALKTLIEHDPREGLLKISQEAYSIEVLQRFGFMDAKPALTPAMDQGPNSMMTPEDLAENADPKDREAFLKQWPIYECIGCLWWLVSISRLDCMTAVQAAAQHVSKPSKKLWTWVSRILRYLKGTTHLGLIYKRNIQHEQVAQAAHLSVDRSAELKEVRNSEISSERNNDCAKLSSISSSDSAKSSANFSSSDRAKLSANFSSSDSAKLSSSNSANFSSSNSAKLSANNSAKLSASNSAEFGASNSAELSSTLSAEPSTSRNSPQRTAHKEKSQSTALTIEQAYVTTRAKIVVTLTGAADSSFADGAKARSTLGQVYYLNGCVVDYNTKLSTRVLSSSTDAECASLVLFGKENAWLRDLLVEMGIFTLSGPTVVDEDNSAAITLSAKYGPTKGSRHFEIAWYTFKDRIEFGEIMIQKVNTLDNCADLFTKQLALSQFTKLRDMMMGEDKWQKYFMNLKSKTKISVHTLTLQVTKHELTSMDKEAKTTLAYRAPYEEVWTHCPACGERCISDGVKAWNCYCDRNIPLLHSDIQDYRDLEKMYPTLARLQDVMSGDEYEQFNLPSHPRFGVLKLNQRDELNRRIRMQWPMDKCDSDMANLLDDDDWHRAYW